MQYTIPHTLSLLSGNNVFSYDIRKKKTLFVPSIITGTLEDVKIGDEVVFSDIDESGKLTECVGLKNFIRTTWNGIPMIIFDNHNHAFYFWHEAREKGIISDGATLIHIDEHSDMREPKMSLEVFLNNDTPPEWSDFLEVIFRYTNEILEVGNYILPAQKDGLIGFIHSILTESQLQEYKKIPLSDNMILNLDLDFFEPRLDDISFNLKKETILYFAKQSKLITIATSPYFIDQTRAINILRRIFW